MLDCELCNDSLMVNYTHLVGWPHIWSKNDEGLSGIKVSENKVATSLKRVAPESYQKRRQNTLNRVNPVCINDVDLIIKAKLCACATGVAG